MLKMCFSYFFYVVLDFFVLLISESVKRLRVNCSLLYKIPVSLYFSLHIMIYIYIS